MSQDNSKDLLVAIPVLNNTEGLLATLRSLDRDDEVFDIVVFDDGSTPPVTLNQSTFSHNIHLVRQTKNKGIARTLAEALQYSERNQYKFLARIDAGDRHIPGRFTKQMEIIISRDIALVGSWATAITPTGKVLHHLSPPTKHKDIIQTLHVTNPVIHPTMMFDIKKAIDVGGYRDTFPHAEDYDLVVRFAQKYKLENIPEKFLLYEISPSQITHKYRKEQTISRLRILATIFNPFQLTCYTGFIRTCVGQLIPKTLASKIKKSIPYFRWH